VGRIPREAIHLMLQVSLATAVTNGMFVARLGNPLPREEWDEKPLRRFTDGVELKTAQA
jgi:hypothetical protein